MLTEILKEKKVQFPQKGGHQRQGERETLVGKLL